MWYCLLTWNDHSPDFAFRHICCSVSQSCLTLWKPMNCSMPGFPVLHHFLEFVQTHVHWGVDTIQPSYPLSSPSPPGFSLSQHQNLFKWVGSSYPKYWSFSFSISPSNEYSGLISFKTDWFNLLAVHGTLESSSSATEFEGINSLVLSLFYCPALKSIHDYWKNHSFD